MSSRLAPIPYDEWDFEALAEISPGIKPPELSVVAFFAHHPDLAKAFLSWNRYVNSRRSTLPRPVREIAILRVAWRRRSRYEWAQHLRIARRAGVDEGTIATIRSGERAGFPGLVIAAVDEITDGSAVSDSTYASLAAELSERQLIDLVFLIGTYSLLSAAFNTFRVELDPGLDASDMDTRGFDSSKHDQKG